MDFSKFMYWINAYAMKQCINNNSEWKKMFIFCAPVYNSFFCAFQFQNITFELYSIFALFVCFFYFFFPSFFLSLIKLSSRKCTNFEINMQSLVSYLILLFSLRLHSLLFYETLINEMDDRHYIFIRAVYHNEIL